MNNIIVIIGVKKNSERIPNKNIKKFGDSNILEILLNKLKNVKYINKIIVSSDCINMLNISKKYGCLIHKRDLYYASCKVQNNEYWEYLIYNVLKSFNIKKKTPVMFCHVTTPLIKIETYNNIINKFLNLNENDSLMTVCPVNDFLWDTNKCKSINYDSKKHIKSQDLPENIVKMISGIFMIMYDKALYNNSFIGKNPYFYRLTRYESIDIDYPIDFSLAENIYKSIPGYK